MVVYQALIYEDRNERGATHPISGTGNVNGDDETTLCIALLTKRLLV